MPPWTGRVRRGVRLLRRQLARPAAAWRGGSHRAELDVWATLAVEGWFEGADPWLTAADGLRGSLARLVGAGVDEVVAMNTLTVNLHLLMATFYRPVGRAQSHRDRGRRLPLGLARRRIAGAPPRLRPRRSAVVRLRPRAGESALRTEDIVGELERMRGSVALVLLGRRQLPHRRAARHPVPSRQPVTTCGAVVGWDLAHAVGNVPLDLHAWDVDWAAWCHYKYVNAGPGGPGGRVRA